MTEFASVTVFVSVTVFAFVTVIASATASATEWVLTAYAVVYSISFQKQLMVEENKLHLKLDTVFSPIELHTSTQSTMFLLPPSSKSQLQEMECSDGVRELSFIHSHII